MIGAYLSEHDAECGFKSLDYQISMKRPTALKPIELNFQLFGRYVSFEMLMKWLGRQ